MIFIAIYLTVAVVVILALCRAAAGTRRPLREKEACRP